MQPRQVLHSRFTSQICPLPKRRRKGKSEKWKIGWETDSDSISAFKSQIRFMNPFKFSLSNKITRACLQIDKQKHITEPPHAEKKTAKAGWGGKKGRLSRKMRFHLSFIFHSLSYHSKLFSPSFLFSLLSLFFWFLQYQFFLLLALNCFLLFSVFSFLSTLWQSVHCLHI